MDAASGRTTSSPEPAVGPPDREVGEGGPTRPTAAPEPESESDEPPVVALAGPDGVARRTLLADLLGVGTPALRVPQGSFLVVNGGFLMVNGDAAESNAAASDAAGPALARPPRRVELILPAPRLGHVGFLDTPDTAALGVAGRRVVSDAVEWAGALLFVFAADRLPGPADLELLRDVAVGEAAVLFAVAPPAAAVEGPPGGVPAIEGPPGGAPGVEAYQAVVLDAVPALADAPWFVTGPAGPTGAEFGGLVRALTEWAALAAVRRADLPPAVSQQARPVPVAAGVATDWAERVDIQTSGRAHRARRALALEVANIHLRCVQALVFGPGCPGLPEVLDRELHALSIEATRTCEAGVREVLDDAAAELDAVVELDAAGGEVRDRVAAAVRRESAGLRRGRELDRVLLVESDGGVRVMTEPGAAGALAAYPARGGRRGSGEILPPLGIALAGSCYQHWRNPIYDNVPKARSWLHRVLREVELELSREVVRRFAAVHATLARLLSDAVTDSAPEG